DNSSERNPPLLRASILSWSLLPFAPAQSARGTTPEVKGELAIRDTYDNCSTRSAPIQKLHLSEHLLRERVIQTLHQLHAAIEKILIRQPLPGPALEYLVDAVAFFAT